MDLNTLWFLLVGVMFTAYAVLDGFDLGVGILHLFTRGDAERRAMISCIGPVWDGNEVWLVTGVGALFGAFPDVYSTLFSGFYTAYMLILVGLIFRGVAIEFRNLEASKRWRRSWDVLFAAGSAVPTFIFGIMVGNLITGLPIGPDKEVVSQSFLALLRPYPLLVGFFVVSLFTLHGALWLNFKLHGEMQTRVQKWAKRCFWIFALLYIVTTSATIALYPHMIANFGHFRWAWVLVALTGLAVLNVPRTLHLGYELKALLNVGCIIAGTFALFGIGLFPDLIRSSLDPAYSLTLQNAASSQSTLSTMLVMAIVGIPFILSYTVGIYWVFRGKVTVDKDES
ncbi:MAG: cytochrome d ubiquinol oxidase subunit II [Cyanobacteria bacterium SZAS LIN-2]|nr:cytochrome d ubiquinol oxidase subunit II [Cyanobacteria bacterium SZAS LIN-2]